MDGSIMELTERFAQAFTYAFQLHRKQTRKGTDIPYMGHLLEVAGIVIEYEGNEDEGIAALLHDAIEDQGGAETRDEIRRRFGDRVVEIIDGCTDTDETPKPPWRERKEEYVNHAAEANPSVLLVSAADKLHNVRSIIKDYRKEGDGVFERFTGKKEGTLWYYRALVGAFRKAGNLSIIDEFERLVSELERLAR